MRWADKVSDNHRARSCLQFTDFLEPLASNRSPSGAEEHTVGFRFLLCDPSWPRGPAWKKSTELHAAPIQRSKTTHGG